MPRKAAESAALLNSIAQNLFNALPIFRKRVLHLDSIQRDCHIPLSHVQVLALLQDHGSMSVSEISQRLGIAKPNITPLADRLIADGLAERQRDPADRRVSTFTFALKERKSSLPSVKTLCSRSMIGPSALRTQS